MEELHSVEGQNFTKKAHSMKSKERPWALTKEGPIHAARRIDIKALCMFRFPAKKAIKKVQQKNWAGIPRGYQRLGILGTCSTAKVRLKRLKGEKHKR